MGTSALSVWCGNDAIALTPDKPKKPSKGRLTARPTASEMFVPHYQHPLMAGIPWVTWYSQHLPQHLPPFPRRTKHAVPGKSSLLGLHRVPATRYPQRYTIPTRTSIAALQYTCSPALFDSKSGEINGRLDSAPRTGLWAPPCAAKMLLMTINRCRDHCRRSRQPV